MPETGEMNPDSCQAHACTVAEVEVDDETGVVEVLAMHNVYEVGRAINPAMATQQIEGGAWMGISHALFETTEPYYPARDHGPRDFEEYLMPGPADNAVMESVIIEFPAANGPFGAKGIGEMTANAPIPAIANAIFDACGVRLEEMPFTPERVLRGLTTLQTRDRGAGPERFAAERYLADEGLLTAVHLSLSLQPAADPRGRAGRRQDRAGEGARARTQARELIRLQCYEGLDAAQALYEWDHPKQLLAIRACEAEGRPVGELYDPEFLLERPLLRALRVPCVLLIDEIDRADSEFEAFLLEFLSDFQITIPELGTIVGGHAADRRDDVEPDARAARRAEAALPVSLDRVPGRRARAGDHRRQACPGWPTTRPLRWSPRCRGVRRLRLIKPPGIAETIDWAQAAKLLYEEGAAWPVALRRSLGLLLKEAEDTDEVLAHAEALGLA